MCGDGDNDFGVDDGEDDDECDDFEGRGCEDDDDEDEEYSGEGGEEEEDVVMGVGHGGGGTDCVQATAHLVRMEFLAVPTEAAAAFVPVVQQTMGLFAQCPRSCLLVALALCVSLLPPAVLAPGTPAAAPFAEFFDRTARWFAARTAAADAGAGADVGAALAQAGTDLFAQYARHHPVLLHTCCRETCTAFDVAVAFLKNRRVRQHVGALCSVFAFLALCVEAAPRASALAAHVRSERGGGTLLDELLQCLRSTALPDVAVPRAAAVLQALVEHHGDCCRAWFADTFLGLFAPFRARLLAASGHGNSEFTAVLTSLLSALHQADGI